MNSIKYLSLLMIFSIIGCSNQIKFDKIKWTIKDDMEFPYREKMIDDLIETQRLSGLKYFELINLLGVPQYKDSISIAYEINTRYDRIDPIYTKRLNFTFSKDSVITSFKVEEWKK